MSPEEWLKSQQSDSMSPEEWLKSQTITSKEPTSTLPTEDLTKPSFRMASPVRGKAEPLQQVKAAAEEERNRPKYSWQDMITNEDLQKYQRDFLKIRSGVDSTNLSNEEVAKQFMAGMRRDEFNTFSLIGSINALKNANMDDKLKLEYGKQLYEQVASATEKGGQPGAQPYVDVAKAALTDLTNYLGLGVAAAGKKALQVGAKKEIGRMLGTEGAEAAAKGKIASLLTPTPGKVAGAAIGTEMAVGAGQDVLAQKEEQTRATIRGEEPEAIDYTRVAAMSLLSGVFGYGEAKGVMAMRPGKSGKEQLNTILQSKTIVPATPNAPQTPAERVLTDKVTENMDTVVEEFMNIQGGRILDDINPATALTDAKIQKDLSGRAVRVAMYVMEQDPSFRVKPGQKTSTAIAEVFSNLDNIDDAVLEQAIRKEGLTPEEFAQANKLTVTEAAQVMQQYSAAAKAMKRLTQIDPEFAKQAEALFGKPDEYTTALGRVGQIVSTVERESKAWIVSSIGTTVRNVIGTGTGLIFNSAASLIEGSLYTIGRTIKAASDPTSAGVTNTLKKGVGDTMRDAFGVYGYLFKSGLAAETTDVLLKHNPALRNHILSATQESTANELSKAARLFNSLNVAQDAFFRRAIFTASVEKNMRRLGVDMYQTLAEGKVIPADILKESTDDTLKATFSYTPKQQKKGITSFESGAEAMGNLFVKAAEFPGGSLLATFPRFMSNAIAFQYRYSIFGGASGAGDMLEGSRMLAKGDAAGAGLLRKGQENLAKGVVGTAALAAAYDYRLNNQETEWYNYRNEDGTTTDVRSLFPLGPILAVGDFLAKRKMGLEPKTAEALEAIVGMKMPAGTQGQMLDQIFAAFSSEKEADKIEVAIGKVLGDFTARFSQPFVFKSAYEFFDLFRDEGSIQRDPNVITAEGTVDRITQAAINRVQAKLPVVKEQLPEAVVRLQEGPAYKEGEFFYSLVGVRDVPNKTPEEKEIKRLGIDPYRLYGPSSGDREYDRAFVKEANQYVIEAIRQTMERPDYQNLPANEQRYKLTKIVSKALTVPKEIVAAKMTAEDFDKVQKMRFNKLTLEERNIINNRYAEENNGVTLEEANDYRSIDEYLAKAIEPLKYALGGFVGKIGAKKAAKTATGSVLDFAKKTSKESPVATQISDIVEQELKTTSPAIDQMSAVLQGKPAATPVKKAPAVKPKQSLAAQTEEALPSPTPKEEIAPAPSAAFTDDDYKLGEKFMLESGAYDEDMLKNMKSANYEGYMDLVHSSTGMAKGIKYKDMPPSPFKAKEVFEENVDIEGRPLSEIKPAKTVKLSEEPTYIVKGAEEGDLNRLAEHIGSDATFTSDRNKVLNTLKELRKDTFFDMQNDMAFDKYDEEVLGVLQGEYRYAKGVELDPSNPAMVKDALPMADALQKRLDKLREQYKDKPPVVLFHGQGSGNVENVRKGFLNPQKLRGTKHDELLVGAPSFTKDLNLNFRSEKFGSIDPENYVATEIPYADYVFSRVNMRPAEYDSKDLNVLARSVSGTRFQARPISLPRGQFGEHEDIFVDAEKLKIKNSSAAARVEDLVTGEKSLLPEQLSGKVQKTRELLTSTSKLDNITPAQAYKAYKEVRDTTAMLTYMSRNVQPYGGRGQQASVRMEQLIDGPERYTQLTKIADALEDAGSKEKAVKLRRFARRADVYNKSDKGLGDVDMAPEKQDATIQDMRKKRLDKVFKASEQLAKGGFVSKRR